MSSIANSAPKPLPESHNEYKLLVILAHLFIEVEANPLGWRSTFTKFYLEYMYDGSPAQFDSVGLVELPVALDTTNRGRSKAACAYLHKLWNYQALCWVVGLYDLVEQPDRSWKMRKPFPNGVCIENPLTEEEYEEAEKDFINKVLSMHWSSEYTYQAGDAHPVAVGIGCLRRLKDAIAKCNANGYLTRLNVPIANLLNGAFDGPSSGISIDINPNLVLAADPMLVGRPNDDSTMTPATVLYLLLHPDYSPAKKNSDGFYGANAISRTAAGYSKPSWKSIGNLFGRIKSLGVVRVSADERRITVPNTDATKTLASRGNDGPTVYVFNPLAVLIDAVRNDMRDTFSLTVRDATRGTAFDPRVDVSVLGDRGRRAMRFLRGLEASPVTSSSESETVDATPESDSDSDSDVTFARPLQLGNANSRQRARQEESDDDQIMPPTRRQRVRSRSPARMDENSSDNDDESDSDASVIDLHDTSQDDSDVEMGSRSDSDDEAPGPFAWVPINNTAGPQQLASEPVRRVDWDFLDMWM